MRNTPVLFASLLMLALVGCKSTETPAPGSGLEGTWRLISRQCYCTPTPVPDETVTFTATRFTFYKGNRTMRIGKYRFTKASPLCLSNGIAIPVVRFGTEFQFPDPTAPYSTDVQYTLSGNTLTLDYGSPCDFPLDTYERLQ